MEDGSMSDKLVTFCDVCPKQKGETNHWQTVTGSPKAPTFQPFDFLSASDRKDIQARGDLLIDSCSQGCATELFQRWLDTGLVLKPEAEAA
jgi:hypothetical protein